MIIAEDLLLLLMDDETGKPLTEGTRLDYALAGAVLVELAVTGNIDAPKEQGRFASERLVVIDPTPPDDPVLAEALTQVHAHEGKKPQSVLGKLAKGLRQRLLEQLSGRGVLQLESNKILGLFPTTRWPAADSHHEHGVRERLQAVVVQGAAAQQREAALISMLSAIDAAPKVLGGDRKLVKQRAKQIAEQDWAGGAVKKAVEAVYAGVAAAMVGAAAASAGG